MEDQKLIHALHSLCLDEAEKQRMPETLDRLQTEGALPAQRPGLPVLRYAAISLAACAVVCIGILGILRLYRPQYPSVDPGTAACFAHPFFTDLADSGLYVASQAYSPQFYTIAPDAKAQLAGALTQAEYTFRPAGEAAMEGAEPVLLYYQQDGQAVCAAFWCDARIIRWQCGEESSVLSAPAALFDTVAALTAQPSSLGASPYDSYEMICTHPQEMLEFLFGDGGGQALPGAPDPASYLPELRMIWAARSDNFWVTHDDSQAYTGEPLYGAFCTDDGTVIRDDAVRYVPVLCDGTVQAVLFMTENDCRMLDTNGLYLQSVLDRDGSAVLVRRIYDEVQSVYLVDDAGSVQSIAVWGDDRSYPVGSNPPPADPGLYTAAADTISRGCSGIPAAEQQAVRDVPGLPPFGDVSTMEVRILTTAYAPDYIIPDDAQLEALAQLLADCDWQEEAEDPGWDGEYLLVYLDAGSAFYEVRLSTAGYLQYAQLTGSAFEGSEIHTYNCPELAAGVRELFGSPSVVCEPQDDAAVDFATRADAVRWCYFSVPAGEIPLYDGQSPDVQP